MGENYVLACPICKMALAGYYFFPPDPRCCAGCGRTYETLSGVIDLFPQELSSTAYLVESYRYDRVVDKGQEKYPGLEKTYPDKRAAFIRETLETYGATGYVNIGPGFGALEIETKGMDRLAIDLCWGFLRHMKAICPKVVCVRGAAEHLPLLTDSVKCLVADSTFQSVIDREAFLYEIARVTSIGSLLILSIARRWNYPRRPQNGFNVLRPDEFRVLKRFIHELGFDVEFKYQDVGTGAWSGYPEHGDYLWIIGQKTR